MDVCLGDSPAGAIAGPVILAPIINQADTVRRVPLTLETMAGSPDRLLGLFVADPEMSGDAVHYHRERVLISKQASLRGTKPARLDAGADLAMVGAAGRTLLNRASAQCGHKRNKAAKTTEISATMQAPLITRSAIFSIAGDRPNVAKAAKSAVSMHAMATTRKNISTAVSDGSPAEPIGRTMPPARIPWHICRRCTGALRSEAATSSI
jgi:hypothetical protein